MSYATSPSGADHLMGNLPSRSMKNTVGMCFFLKYDDAKMADIVNAVTGWGVSAADLLDEGERSLSLARLFNLREGLGTETDRLPEQVTKPHRSGVLSKVRLDQDDLAEQVRAYYRARGWADDGAPTRETLERLGIAEYAIA
jgi:aldehyde:ferredoxin oxidoreductase